MTKKCESINCSNRILIRLSGGGNQKHFCDECVKAHDREYYYKNSKKTIEDALQRHAQIKLETILHYCENNPRCQCPGCHTHHIELLTIDHIKGNGANHRQKINGGKRRQNNGVARGCGTAIHYWLRKNNYPKGFQILCGSCNFAKRNKKQCPLHGQLH